VVEVASTAVLAVQEAPTPVGWLWLDECITGQSLVGFPVSFTVDKQDRHKLPIYLMV
jgi:hypothetical protein